ncbi:MAG: alpha/beta fold hydrolase [Methylomonas sp.]|nr:alpha/beta fold hydrolase [Methylomonas sp.]
MKASHYPQDWPDIDTALFNRSVKLFNAVKNLLSVKFQLYADTQLLQGDIFLFNHFSRFETFIPQFLIFEKTGAYSCAIAAGEFFGTDSMLSNYLQHVGVFPHDHPRLFAMLAGQILRGRKVVVFPEGGMVKDRRVIDKQGEYSIYSRIAGNRRKQHTGPAVLGQGVQALKTAIRYAFQHEQVERLQHWKEILQFDNLDELMATALKPTLIVPANITFYPIRASENLLFKSVELFADSLSLRQAEELIIEGNIMLRDTDMDIRMSSPVDPCCVWDWRTRKLMELIAPGIREPDDVFQLRSAPRNWKQRLLGYFFQKNARCSRNRYMEKIYANVTINLSHLASTLIMSLIGDKRQTIEKSRFYSVLYIAIKQLQNNPDIHLHRSLLDPDEYGELVQGVSARFDQFICVAKQAELLIEQDGCYRFLPKLCADHDFDSIRLENPIAVYNNEAAPLRGVRNALLEADRVYRSMDARQLAAWHFDDEHLQLALEQEKYRCCGDGDFYCRETAVADPAPFFIIPKRGNGLGILLIHGLLASPAELRDYGRYLAEQGYTVLGVRLKGHGTSPYALRDIGYEQWFDSVRRGFNILKLHCTKLYLIGFSTGGALALKLAVENHPEIVGVVAVSVPVKFVDPAFMLVPLLHNANTLVRWLSSFEGVKPFIDNTPEHPDINYCGTPVRALYELRRLIQRLQALLPEVTTPSLLLYADRDPVVATDPSAADVFEWLGAAEKTLHIIESDRHGILMENIGNIWAVIDEFLMHRRAGQTGSQPTYSSTTRETVS